MSNMSVENLQFWLQKMQKGTISELQRRIETQNKSAIKHVHRQAVRIPRGQSLVQLGKSQKQSKVIEGLTKWLRDSGEL